MANVPKKLKVKDSAYYAYRARELSESEKAFVSTVSRKVYGYLLSGDEGEGKSRRNLCLMVGQSVECDEGYWSFDSEDDDEDAEPNYSYMVNNDPSKYFLEENPNLDYTGKIPT